MNRLVKAAWFLVFGFSASALCLFLDVIGRSIFAQWKVPGSESLDVSTTMLVTLLVASLAGAALGWIIQVAATRKLIYLTIAWSPMIIGGLTAIGTLIAIIFGAVTSRGA